MEFKIQDFGLKPIPAGVTNHGKVDNHETYLLAFWPLIVTLLLVVLITISSPAFAIIWGLSSGSVEPSVLHSL